MADGNMPQLSAEQQALEQENLQRKGLIDSPDHLPQLNEQQQALERDNLERKGELAPVRQPEPFISYRPVYEGVYRQAREAYRLEAYRLIDKANTLVGELPENATYDQIHDYNMRLKEHDEAQVFRAGFELMANSQPDETRKKANEFKRQMGDLGFDDATANGLWLYKVQDDYRKAYDEYGAVPKEWLLNKKFQDNVDPDTYARLAQDYNLRNGMDGDFSRGWHLAAVQRSLDGQFADGAISAEKYRELRDGYTRLYHYKGDGIINEMGAQLAGIIKPLIDDPLNTTVAAVGSGLVGLIPYAGWFLAPAVFSALTWSRDQRNTALAQTKDLYLQDHPNAKPEDIPTWGADVAYVTDIAINALSGKLLGLTSLGAKALDQLFGKRILGAAERVASDRALKGGSTDISKRVAKILTEYGLGVGGNVIIQSGNTVVQGALPVIAAQSKDRPLGEAVKQGFEQGKKNLSDSFGSMVVLTALGGSPSLFANMIHARSLRNKVENTAATRAIDEIAAESELSKRDPDTAAEISDEAMPSKIHASVDELNTVLKEKGIDPVSTGLLGKRISESKDGTVELTEGEWKNKVPQSVRDLVYKNFANEKGERSLEMLAALSESEIKKLREEYINEIPKAKEYSDKITAIKSDADKQLFASAKNLNSVQRESVSTLVSSVYGATAKTLGVDPSELYARHKIDFSLYDVHDTKPESGSTLANPDVVATYSKGHIYLKENAKFSDVFHEATHWYLDFLSDLANDKTLNPEKRTELDKQAHDIVAWANGATPDYTKPLNKADVNAAQEKFAAGFAAYLMGKEPPKNASGMFSRLKRFMYSLKNTTLFHDFSRLGDTGADAREQHIRENFERTYGETIPDGLKVFSNVLDSIFSADTYDKLINKDWALDPHLDEISMIPFSDSEKAFVLSELRDIAKQDEAEQTRLMENLAMRTAVANLMRTDDLKPFIEQLKKGMDERDLQGKQGFAAFVRRLAKADDLYQEKRAEFLKELKDDPVCSYIDLTFNKENKGGAGLTLTTEGMDLPNDIVTALVKKGYVDNANGLYTFSDLLNDQGLPKEARAFIAAHSDMPQDHALAHWLAREKTRTEKANDKAFKYVWEKKFAKEQDQSRAKLMEFIAKSRKDASMRFHSALVKAFGGAKKQQQIKSEIEVIATYDAGRLTYGEAREQSSLNMATRSNEKISKAMRDHNVTDAVRYTNNATYHYAKAENIAQRKGRIDKTFRSLREFAMKKGKSTAKTYDTEMIELVRHALTKIGVIDDRNRPDIDRIKDDLTERYPDYADEITQACDEIRDAERWQGNYRNTQLRQLELMGNLLTSLKVLASKTRRETAGEIKAQFEADVKALTDTTQPLETKQVSNVKDEHYNPNPKPKFLQRVVKFGRECTYWITEVEKACQRIDRQELGTWHKLVFQPIKDCVTRFKLAYNDVNLRLSKALKDVQIESKMIIAREFIKDGKPVAFGDGEFKHMTTWQLIGFVLNCGTNFDKLMRSYCDDKFRPTESEMKLASSGDPKQRAEFNRIQAEYDLANARYREQQFNAFIQRMVDEGHLNKKIFDACEKIWKVFADVGKQVQRADFELRGTKYTELAPRKIRVTFPDGTTKEYAAGYMPLIMTDKARRTHGTFDKDMPVTDFINQTNEDVLAAHAAENPSFLKDRSAADYEIELDPRILISKIKDELKFVHIIPSVNRVLKLLGDARVAKELDRVRPDAMKDLFMPWLTSVATLKSSAPSPKIAKILQSFTSNVGMGIMCANVVNTLQQTAQLAPLMIKVGNNPALVMKYCTQVLYKYGDLVKEAMTDSEFMRVRISEMHDGINEIYSRLVIESKNVQDPVNRWKLRAKNANNYLKEHAYFLQKKCQNVLDVVAYHAAKEYALKQGMSNLDAIRYADMSVRTVMSSFDIEDTTRIAKAGALTKMFVQFGGYFYSMFNLMQSEITIQMARYGYKNTDPRAWLTGAYVFTCTIAAPAIISEVMQQSIGTRDLFSDDDETRDSAMWSIALSPVKMLTAAVPFFGRELGNVVDLATGRKWFSAASFNVPVFTVISAGETAFKKLASGDPLRGTDIRAAVMLASMILGMPWIVPIAKTSGYAYDVDQGHIRYEDWYEFALGMMTGRASTDTKR